MNNELKDLLVKNFPSLYEYQTDQKQLQPIEFECEQGWFSLIETCSDVIVKRSLIVAVTKVYKKQGRLQFDITSCPAKDRDFISGVIKMAYVLSGICCEICSLQGEMFNRSAIAARCKLHGGTRLRLLKRKPGVDLSFNTKKVGRMWREMIVKLFLQFQALNSDQEPPVTVLTSVEIKGGKLNVEYSGGNDMTNGMVTLLLSYAEKIDAETGKIINFDVMKS